MFPCPNHRYPRKGFLQIRPCEDREGSQRLVQEDKAAGSVEMAPAVSEHPHPQEASSKGEPQHPCTFLQVHHKFHGDRKTRESMPPTGQPGQGHWEHRTQARPEKVLVLSSSHPGATLPQEGQQTSHSCAFLTLGRVCGLLPVWNFIYVLPLLLSRPCLCDQSTGDRITLSHSKQGLSEVSLPPLISELAKFPKMARFRKKQLVLQRSGV